MNKIHHKADQLDLNLLRVFEAVYREQHLSRAAHSLFLTPSAVSHAIARLRQHLDDPLFVRDGRRMSPTPACLRLAPALLDNLAQLRQLLQQWGQFEPKETRQAFRLGVPDAIEPVVLPAVTRLLAEEAPYASLACVGGDRRELGRELAAGHIDTAIDVALPISEPVRHDPLLQDEYCIVMRAGHALGPRPTLRKYLQARHIAVSSRASGPVMEDIALLNLGLQRHIGLRCQSYHSAFRVIEQSDLVLTLPSLLAQQVGASPGLQSCPVPFQLAPVHLHIYWHANAEFDPANLWLRRSLQRVCGENLLRV